MAQADPAATPFLLKMMQWGLSAFRASKGIEGVLDQAISAMEQAKNKPPEPNPMQDAELEEKKAGSMERRAQAVKEIADAIEKMAMIGQPLPVPISSIIDGGLMGASGQTVQDLSNKIDQLVQTATAPKRVVRDPITNKVVGVAPVVQPPQGQPMGAPNLPPPQQPMPQPGAPVGVPPNA